MDLLAPASPTIQVFNTSLPTQKGDLREGRRGEGREHQETREQRELRHGSSQLTWSLVGRFWFDGQSSPGSKLKEGCDRHCAKCQLFLPMMVDPRGQFSSWTLVRFDGRDT